MTTHCAMADIIFSGEDDVRAIPELLMAASLLAAHDKTDEGMALLRVLGVAREKACAALQMWERAVEAQRASL